MYPLQTGTVYKQHIRVQVYLCGQIYAYNLGLNKVCDKALNKLFAKISNTGRYPLYIDTIISMIKYWVRLCKNTHHDPLLQEAYEGNLLMYALRPHGDQVRVGPHMTNNIVFAKLDILTLHGVTSMFIHVCWKLLRFLAV
jgi:hypothetical protein